MRKKIKKSIFYTFFILMIFQTSFAAKEDIKIIFSQGNMNERTSGKVDINVASHEELISAGISKKYIHGILEYRDKVGAFEETGELKRIRGIGNATCRKLSQQLEVREKKSKNPLYINRADPLMLSYYGFSKKEIQRIEKYRSRRGRIMNNRELRNLIDRRKYEKYKDLFRYEK